MMTDEKISNDSKIKQIQELTECGHKFLKSGDTLQATEFFLAAYLQSSSTNNELIVQSCSFNLGACYIASGIPKQGLKYLEQITSLNNKEPENYADLWYNIGIAHHALNEIDEAIVAYEKAHLVYCELKILNLQAECETKLGTCYHLQKRLEDSHTMYQNARNSYRILNDKNNESLSLVNAATVLAEMGNIDECAKLLDILLDLCQELSDKHLQAKIYHEIGLLYISEELLESATECFDQAIKCIKDVSNKDKQLLAMVYQNLGAVLNATLLFESAIQYHVMAADLYGELGDKNSQTQVFCNLGFAYAQNNENLKALKSFQLAIQAAKDCGDKNAQFRAAEGMGAILFRLSDYEEAISTYKSALCLLPYSTDQDSDSADRVVSKLTDALRCKLVLEGNRDSSSKNVESKSSLKKGRSRFSRDQRHNTLVAKGLEEDEHMMNFIETDSFKNLANEQQKPNKSTKKVNGGTEHFNTTLEHVDDISIESFESEENPNDESSMIKKSNDQLEGNENKSTASLKQTIATGENVKRNQSSGVCLVM